MWRKNKISWEGARKVTADGKCQKEQTESKSSLPPLAGVATAATLNLTERSSVGTLPELLEDSRGSAVCGVHSRAVRGGGGREEEDGLPEHPLVTLFKEQEQLGRGTRTTAIRGTEERGENRHVEMENGQDIGTLIDTLSLSNNVDQLSSDGEEHEQRKTSVEISHFYIHELYYSVDYMYCRLSICDRDIRI